MQQIFKDVDITVDDFSGETFGKEGQIEVLGWPIVTGKQIGRAHV